MTTTKPSTPAVPRIAPATSNALCHQSSTSEAMNRITNARRQPFIGPKPLIRDKHIVAFIAIMAAAFAAAWLLTWIACELKNLS